MDVYDTGGVHNVRKVYDSVHCHTPNITDLQSFNFLARYMLVY